MGNTGSNSGDRRTSGHQSPSPPSTAPQPDPPPSPYVFAAAAPYRRINPNPNHGPPPPPPSSPPPLQPHPPILIPPMPSLYDQGYRGTRGPLHRRLVEQEQAVIVRNDANLRKGSLRMEPDEDNAGRFLVCFTFDAAAPGRITILYFAKEGADSSLTSTVENVIKSVSVTFKEGLGQKFRQPSGTGIDFSAFHETLLGRVRALEVFPLAVKLEASQFNDEGSVEVQKPAENYQVTKAVFRRERGEYQVGVVEQILWVNGTRYELQDIYGVDNSGDSDANVLDLSIKCVICLSEPRDTTVLPCRHMCMCSKCAVFFGYRTNRCPICRQPAESLMEISASILQQQELAEP